MKVHVFNLHNHPGLVAKAVETEPELHHFWSYLCQVPDLRFRVALDEPGTPSLEFIRNAVRTVMNAAIDEECYELPKPH